MMKRIFATLGVSLLLSTTAMASGGSEAHPKQLYWQFDGAFGTVDKRAAQRGYQVYKQVCAACHSMSGLHYRNLSQIGFTEAEIKAIAAEKSVMDGPNDDGEMFERPALPADRFVPPYPNEKAARAANGGAYPPDLTLMAKARHDGVNYIYSLLTGYENAPADFHLTEGKYYNPYFPGRQISMPPPLMEGAVTYEDGTNASIDQMARDVVVFLQWAAEPEMEHRKEMGIKVIIFLLIATILSYIAKKRIWKNVK